MHSACCLRRRTTSAALPLGGRALPPGAGAERAADLLAGDGAALRQPESPEGVGEALAQVADEVHGVVEAHVHHAALLDAGDRPLVVHHVVAAAVYQVPQRPSCARRRASRSCAT